MPCSPFFVASYFISYILFDHVRGLGTLVFFLVLLPIHLTKRTSDQKRTAPLSPEEQMGIALCTNQPGTHYSCAALYFWCAANGIVECLASGTHGHAFRSTWSCVMFFVFLGMTVVLTALLLDSLTQRFQLIPAKSEDSVPQTHTLSSIVSAP